jgi:hypothetical protein
VNAAEKNSHEFFYLDFGSLLRVMFVCKFAGYLMNHRFVRRYGTTFLLAALIAFLLFQTASGVVDLDLFHEMALAREIVETGSVPWTDSFAYTPTVGLVVHHEWGLGMIALILAKIAGGTGIILLKFSLIFGLGWVVWSTARRRNGSPLIVCLFLGLAIILSDYGFSTVRAHMFSYLFAALFLAGFDLDRKGNRTWLFGVAILFPIWANIHGGCLVGAALFATHWFEQVIRRQPHWHLFWMGLALIPLAAINPWGFEFHRYLIHAMLLPRPAIAEWSPLWSPESRVRLLNFCVSLPFLVLILMQTGVRRLPGQLLARRIFSNGTRSRSASMVVAISFGPLCHSGMCDAWLRSHSCHL